MSRSHSYILQIDWQRAETSENQHLETSAQISQRWRLHLLRFSSFSHDTIYLHSQCFSSNKMKIYRNELNFTPDADVLCLSERTSNTELILPTTTPEGQDYTGHCWIRK